MPHLVIRVGCTTPREREPPVAIRRRICERHKTVAVIGNGDVRFNRCERAIVVRGRDVVGLEVFAFDEDGIHRFSASEVDVQYRFPIGSVDGSGYIAIDGLARVRYAGERHRDTGREGFGFCE